MADADARPAEPALRRGAALAIAVLVLAGLPQVGDTFGQLARVARLVGSQPARLLEPLRTPRAGEQVLGPMAEAVALLRAEGARGYHYSPGIAADELAVQRLIEGAWPIRPQRDARIRVSFLSEPGQCPVLAEREIAGFDRLGVRLARCP